jgi:hypothetical protein
MPSPQQRLLAVLVVSALALAGVASVNGFSDVAESRAARTAQRPTLFGLNLRR